MRGRFGIGHDHHVAHAASSGSCHHVAAIGVELSGAQMAMGIDEHPM